MKLKTTTSIAFFAFLITFSVSAQFSQKPLGYSFDALEPYIDTETMTLHYSKHHAGYISKLNAAIKGTNAENLSLEAIFKNITDYSITIRNNAGGHYNHQFFWTIFTPEKNTKPSQTLQNAIERDFGSFDNFKSELTNAATGLFGSGWAWVFVDKNGKLLIGTTANQDNPLMSDCSLQGKPILGIDVWEHAYYLNYQNKRGDYIANLWNIFDWNTISKYFDEAIKN